MIPQRLISNSKYYSLGAPVRSVSNSKSCSLEFLEVG